MIWEADPLAFINDVICLHNNPTAPPIPLDDTAGSRGHRGSASSRPSNPIPLDITGPPPKKPRLSPREPSTGPRATDHLVNDPIYEDPNAPPTHHSKPVVRPTRAEEAVFPDQPESSTPRAFDSTERPPDSWPTPDTSIPAHHCLGPSSVDSQNPERVPDSTCLPQQDHKSASAARPPSSLQSPGTSPQLSTAAHALAHPSELISGDRMRLGRVLQSRRHDSYDATLDRLEMLQNLHSMSQVEAATVLQQMSPRHVKHLYKVFDLRKFGIGLGYRQLLEDYLKFWRCWEKTEVFGVEQALGMKRSSCFSVVDLEEEGDIDLKIKVSRDEGTKWIFDRHPPFTLGSSYCTSIP